jgi:hypothetical protein
MERPGRPRTPLPTAGGRGRIASRRLSSGWPAPGFGTMISGYAVFHARSSERHRTGCAEALPLRFRLPVVDLPTAAARFRRCSAGIISSQVRIRSHIPALAGCAFLTDAQESPIPRQWRSRGLDSGGQQRGTPNEKTEDISFTAYWYRFSWPI